MDYDARLHQLHAEQLAASVDRCRPAFNFQLSTLNFLMAYQRSLARKLAAKVASLITLGVSADRINPPFTPALKWVAAVKLSEVTTLQVNVAPFSVTAKRSTRAHLDLNHFIGIQIVKKITTDVQATFDKEVDDLAALGEWMVRWLAKRDNSQLVTDENEVANIQEVSITEFLDWELLEVKRTFHQVLAVNVYKLQEASR